MRGGTIMAVGFGLFLFLAATTPFCFGANVTYDHRALVIDGKRRVLVSGSIHYPRSTPEMWPDLIQKSKDGGLDVIETYVFWNLHEPVRGQYDFEGNKDLVKFVKLVKEAGLFVHLRIGPYVCAEWNYGGFPLWLHFIPGIVLRTDNEPFKAEMKKFTAKIVDMMKQENLYASQGGPIILSQIDTCNGFYCDQYTPNSNKKPKMWTENWSGWFSSFGDALPYRPVEDLAFAVVRFYQLVPRWNKLWRTSGGPFITTSYDYDAPIDEYGLVRQPKWGHLKDVHKAIKLCEEAMVATDPKKTSSLGSNLEATVYKTESGQCAAFLANTGTQSDATVNFNGNSYHLPAWSVSILPDCKSVVLNTAKINSVSTIANFVRQPSKDDTTATDAFFSGWSWINEPVGISSDSAFTKQGLLEQINTTADQSDYLWYSLSIETKGDSKTVLHVDSLGHTLYAFINGALAGSGKGRNDNPKVSIDVPNYGAFFDKTGAGVTGPVQLKGSQNGSTVVDLSSQQWTYQIGLKGEELGLSSGSSSLWVSKPTLPKNQPLVWYKGSLRLEKMSEELRKAISAAAIRQSYHSLLERRKVYALGFQSLIRFRSITWTSSDEETRRIARPTLSLGCPSPNQVISEIKFASFGTPLGTCGSFSHGRCSSKRALSVVEQACIGSRSCNIGVSVNTFGDPCSGITKSLAVEASCG
ncbi:hypothetical protein DH2020_000161 [Rehmannia glutinosa]|uniref:beta-galactosidase n=1 Tax=Rehmannia glutinosa TaxID=99300 RepID=A0ABR0XVR0_REHGL